MKLIFFGPQGSGKGTQGKIIADKLGLCHISTGDLLRQAKGDLKEEIDSYIVNGNLVPDELILKLLQKRISNNDCNKGIILDGFPRNISQAKMLDTIMSVDKVIEIDISDDESVKRISGRAVCKKCGINWNLFTQPKPKNPEFCDECGEKLFRREDDNEEALRKRLEIYHNDTEPILEHYSSIKINGEKEIGEVTEMILEELEK